MKRKIAITIAIMALLAAAVLLPACNTPSAAEDPIPPAIVDGGGNPLLPGKVYDMPENIKFTSASAAADASISVRAIIQPANATDPSVEWSMSFIMSDPPTLTEEEVNRRYVPGEFVNMVVSGNAVTLSLKKEFNVAIRLTATSVSDPDKSMSCRLDYQSRFEVKGLNLTNGGTTYSLPNQSVNITMDNVDYALDPVGTWKYGTYTPEVDTATEYSIKINPFFMEFARKAASADTSIKIDFSALSNAVTKFKITDGLTLGPDFLYSYFGENLYLLATNSFLKAWTCGTPDVESALSSLSEPAKTVMRNWIEERTAADGTFQLKIALRNLFDIQTNTGYSFAFKVNFPDVRRAVTQLSLDAERVLL